MAARKKIYFVDVTDSDWMAYAAIFVTILLTFGLFISRLGLYGSQWQRVLSPGGGGIGQYQISGWITFGLISLIGKNVFIYHVLNVFLLFILGIMVYKFLVGAGMGRVYSLAVTLLYLVYPGFSQASSAFDFTIILVGLIAALGSLGFYTHTNTSNGLRKTIDFWCGVLLSLFSMLMSPVSAFFMGITAFIYFAGFSKGIFSRKSSSILIGFALLIGSFAIPMVYLYGKAGISARIITQSIKSLAGVYLLSWRKIIAFPTGGLQILFYFIGLALAIAILAFVLKKITNKESNHPEKEHEHLYIAIISLAAGLVLILFLGIFSQTIGTEYPEDLNLAVVGLFGSVFVVSLIRELFENKYQVFLFATLIGLSAGARYQSTERFAVENKRMQDFLSQLQVRADSIQPGTSLLVEQLPFEFTSRESVQALINNRMGMVGSSAESIQIVPSENPEVREFLANSDQESTRLRIDNYEIHINKQNLAAIWIPERGCLQVLEPGGVYGEIPYGLALASRYSDPGEFVVKNMSDVLQLDKFRTTIEVDRCFKTQLIQRYSAAEQWDDVISTFTELQKTSGPDIDFSIVKPVLIAMIEKGRLEEIAALTHEFGSSPEQNKSICQIMAETMTRNSDNQEVAKTVKKAMEESGCH